MIPKEFLGGADHMTPEVLAHGEIAARACRSRQHRRPSTDACRPSRALRRAGHRHAVRVADVRLQPDLVGQARDAREHRSDPRRLQHLGVRPAGQLGAAQSVAVVDLRNMDRPTVERRASTGCGPRGRGTVLFWPAPVDGKALSHPDFDWFWGRAAALGVMPMVHVGAGRPNIDLGWHEEWP